MDEKSMNLEAENEALKLRIDSLQKKVDALVANTTAESAKIRTDTSGVVHDTLEDRLQADFTKPVKKADLPYTKIGNAAEFLSSIYLKNDHNLFGRLADGSFANLATMEQNDIAKIGDYLFGRLWIAANEYVSIRSPKLELVEKSTPSGKALSPVRTVYHTGNFSNHALIYSSGKLKLAQGVRTPLTLLTSPISVYPAGAWRDNSYRVPRTGLYAFNIVIRPEAISQQISFIRLGYTSKRGKTSTHFDLSDKIASNVYQTAFISGDFTVLLEEGDIITPFANALNETITIGTGTKITISFQTDTPIE